MGGGFPGGRPPGAQQLDPAVLLGILVCAGLIGAAVLAIQIFFLLTLSRCLGKVRQRNRQMEPGMVWLNLVPCLNLVWIFLTVTKLADSLNAEFADRGIRMEGDGGRGIGLAYAILVVISAIPYINALSGLPALVCWILYWVKIAGYNTQLDRPSEDYDREDRRERSRPEDDRYR